MFSTVFFCVTKLSESWGRPRNADRLEDHDSISADVVFKRFGEFWRFLFNVN